MGLAKIWGMTAGSLLDDFYEGYRDSLEENVDKNPYKWSSDNGKPVLFNDRAMGDFIALLFEMSNELDKLKVPII
jgi:hypothetical protein